MLYQHYNVKLQWVSGDSLDLIIQYYWNKDDYYTGRNSNSAKEDENGNFSIDSVHNHIYLIIAGNGGTGKYKISVTEE
jgi:hypothetical protein